MGGLQMEKWVGYRGGAKLTHVAFWGQKIKQNIRTAKNKIKLSQDD